MRQVYQALCLVLLLIGAQQAAVVHELSHFTADQGLDLRVDPGSAAHGNCALCPAFAQVATPAFSHSFHIPLLVRAAAERSPEPRNSRRGRRNPEAAEPRTPLPQLKRCLERQAARAIGSGL